MSTPVTEISLLNLMPLFNRRLNRNIRRYYSVDKFTICIFIIWPPAGKNPYEDIISAWHSTKTLSLNKRMYVYESISQVAVGVFRRYKYFIFYFLQESCYNLSFMVIIAQHFQHKFKKISHKAWTRFVCKKPICKLVPALSNIVY